MKKNKLSILFTIMSIMIFAQTYHTVDNSPASTANFTKMSDAITAAKDGDIILVQGSVQSYGNVEVNKKLTIIGPGFFLGKNEVPFTQVNQLPATFDNIKVVEEGSGSLIKGIKILKSYQEGGSHAFGHAYKASNVTFSSCLFNNVFFSRESYNTVLEKSYIKTRINAHLGSLIVRHNISTSAWVPLLSGNQTSVSTYENVLYNDSAISLTAFSPESSHLLRDNIIMSKSINGLVDYNELPTSLNNIFIGKPKEGDEWYFTSGTNSLLANANTVFAGFPDGADYNSETRFKLKNNSPAIGTAANGKNRGAFQQTGGYVLSGISFTPNIYQLEVNETATTENGLTITIGAKANSK